MPKLSEQVAELEELKEHEEERTEQISYQERRIKDLQEQIAMLQRTLGKVRDDLEVRTAAVKKLEELIEELQQELLKTREVGEVQKTKFKELRADLAAVREEVYARQKKIQDLSQDFAEMEWSRTNWKSGACSRAGPGGDDRPATRL